MKRWFSRSRRDRCVGRLLCLRWTHASPRDEREVDGQLVYLFSPPQPSPIRPQPAHAGISSPIAQSCVERIAELEAQVSALTAENGRRSSARDDVVDHNASLGLLARGVRRTATAATTENCGAGASSVAVAFGTGGSGATAIAAVADGAGLVAVQFVGGWGRLSAPSGGGRASPLSPLREACVGRGGVVMERAMVPWGAGQVIWSLQVLGLSSKRRFRTTVQHPGTCMCFGGGAWASARARTCTCCGWLLPGIRWCWGVCLALLFPRNHP